MPVINGVYTKDFPNLGRTPADADLIPIAEVANQITYKTTIGAIFNAKISGTTGRLSKFTGSNTIGNSILNEIGNAIHLTNGGSSFASFGIINPGTPGDPGVDNDCYIGSTINNDFTIRVNNTEAARFDTALRLKIANIQNAITDTDKFLVSDDGVVKYRSGSEVLSDLGVTPGNYVTLDGTQTITGQKTFTADILANSVIFDPTPTTIPTAQGSMYFDNANQTIAAVLNGSTMKIGEDLFFQIKNQSGSLIPKGTALRFDGVVGMSGRVKAVPFLADGTYPSTYFLGVAYEDIANGDDGKALWFGNVRGVNTNDYPAGTVLYASTTVAGGYQTTVPVAPNNIISVAAVVTQGTSNGQLLVRPLIGSNINNDEGVKITSPTTGDLLQLQAGGLWENKTANNAGLVTLAGTQTITGEKSFIVTGEALAGNFISTTSVYPTLFVKQNSTAAIASFQSLSSQIDINANGNISGVNDLILSGALRKGAFTFTLPSASGTLALTSDIHNPVTIGTANGLSLSGQVLSLGLASSINAGALSASDYLAFSNKQNALSGNGFVKISGTTISYDNNSYALSSALSNYLPLSGGTVTGGLTVQGVFKWGQISGGSVQYMYRGDGGIFGRQAATNNAIHSGSTSFLVMNASDTTTLATFNNTGLVTIPSSGSLEVGYTANQGVYKLDVNGLARIQGQLTLGSTITNGTYTYTLPSATGTLALTSNLSAYLPLTGGTLTGALNGTSATFSSTLTASKGTFNGSTSEPVTFERIISGSSIRRYSLAISGAGNFSLYDATADADRLIINPSGNLGLGVTPSAWNAGGKAIEIGMIGSAHWGLDQTSTYRTTNAYWNSGWKYGGTGEAANYAQEAGKHYWSTAPSGTAGNAISFTQAMTLDASGNFGINTNAPTELFNVRYNLAKTDTSTIAISRWNSNEAIGSQFKLNLFAKGSSTSSSRAFIFQTSNEGVANDGVIAFQTAGGNVGIGTTSPLSLSGFTVLEVKGTSAGAVSVSSGGGSAFGRMYNAGSTVIVGTSTNHPLILDTNDTERMRITSGGNVLIGTTTDNGAKLQVNGVATISNGLVVSNAITNTGYLDVPYNVWTTIFTPTTGEYASYMVYAYSAGNGGDYTTTGTVVVNNDSVRIYATGSGGGLSIRVSGTSVQVINVSGVTIGVSFKYLKLN